MRPIYLFSSKINYKTFYKIWKYFPTGGIVPSMMIKGHPIWQMIRDKQLYVYIDPMEKDDQVIFAVKLPKREIMLLSNPK